MRSSPHERDFEIGSRDRRVLSKPMSNCSSRKYFIAASLVIVLASFAIRMHASLHTGSAFWHTDSPKYWNAAGALLAGETMPNNSEVPPALPLALIPFFAVGMEPFAVVWFVQSLLGALTVCIAIGVGRQLAGNPAGLISGLLLAIYPPSVNLSRYLLTETWFVFFIMLGMWLIIRPFRLGWYFGGAALGYAALFRWPGLGVYLAAIVILLILRQRGRAFAAALSGTAVVLILGVVLMSWNAGKPVVISGQAGSSSKYQAVYGGYLVLPDAARSSRGSYVNFLQTDPLGWAYERWVSMATLLSPWPLGNQEGFRRSQATKAIIVLCDLPVLIGSILSIALLLVKKQSSLHWLLVAPLAGSFLFYIALFSQPRYRWGFTPFLIILTVAVLTPVIGAHWCGFMNKCGGAVTQLFGPAISWVNNLYIWRMPVRLWGFLMVPATADRLLAILLHKVGIMGKTEKSWLVSHVGPKMTVVEIGSNQGIFTLLISELVGASGRVIAIEPDPELASCLRSNVNRSGVSNVTVHEVALGTSRDILQLEKHVFNRGDNRLRHSVSESKARFSTSVKVETGDDLLGSISIDLIKVDVQGWEYHVLCGMDRVLLNNPHVVLLLEIQPEALQDTGSSPEQIFDFLVSRGFALSVLQTQQQLTSRKEYNECIASLTGDQHVDLIGVR